MLTEALQVVIMLEHKIVECMQRGNPFLQIVQQGAVLAVN